MSETLNFLTLEKNLEYNFTDVSLLKQAVTHTSYANENHENLPLEMKDNERFEFLGDSVLSMVISDLLMIHFPDYPEGNLSKIRASIVNETRLAEVAKRLGVGGFVLLGKGEEKSGGRNKDSILAGVMEAVIAAIYMDAGFQGVFSFIEKHFSELIEKAKKGKIDFDYKTRLQEYVQARFKETPHYVVVSEKGPDHDKIFEIEIVLGAKPLSSGKGKNKKEAEQNAARKALKDLTI